MSKKEFTIKVTYFKDTGKCYTGEEFKEVFDTVPFGQGCYMYSVKEYFLHQRRNNLPMPGLSSSWKEYILIDCDEGFPILILPGE